MESDRIRGTVIGLLGGRFITVTSHDESLTARLVFCNDNVIIYSNFMYVCILINVM